MLNYESQDCQIYLINLGVGMNDKFAASRLDFGGENIGVNSKIPWVMGDTIEELKEKIKKVSGYDEGIWFVFKKNDEGNQYNNDPIKYLRIQYGEKDIEHDFQ